jgi:stage III sporulation protein AF
VQTVFVFVQRLCALVVVALLADLLMPAGAMRKYVRLACGMLVLHIMIAQVAALFGRGAPDVAARQWTQLVGEMRALPEDAGLETALSAYTRQAERLILARARALGMRDPSVSLGLDADHGVAAVILRERAPSVAAGARLGAGADTAAEFDPDGVREGLAALLGIPARAVWIQKEGDGTP